MGTNLAVDFANIETYSKVIFLYPTPYKRSIL